MTVLTFDRVAVLDIDYSDEMHVASHFQDLFNGEYYVVETLGTKEFWVMELREAGDD